MEVAHIDVFRRDPERFWHFYGDRFQTLEDKQPNGAHRALARLEDAGLVGAVITQNIDRLHASAGSRDARRGPRYDRALLLPAAAGARYPLAEVRARQGSDGRGDPAVRLRPAAQTRRRPVRRVPARRRADPRRAARGGART